MKKIILTALLAISTSVSLIALPLTITEISGVNAGALPGTTRFTFDAEALGSAGFSGGGLTVSFVNGAVVVGSVINQYAAPNLSGANDVGFSNQPNGMDATNYLTSGIGSIEFAFTGYQNYVGLLWGSVDEYNTLTFYNDLMGTSGFLTGADVIGNPNGSQGPTGTTYVNITVLEGFNRIVASSSNFAFEIDNLAIGTVGVPDSSSTVALLGLGLVGLALFRRRMV